MRQYIPVKDSSISYARVNVYGVTPTILKALTRAGTDVSSHVSVGVVTYATSTGYEYYVDYDPGIWGEATVWLDCDPSGNLKSGGGALVDGDRYQKTTFLTEYHVIRTSELVGVHNDYTTDDATVINAALLNLSNNGGGTVLWDGRHAFMAKLQVPSQIHIIAPDHQPRLKYFGTLSGGVNGHVVTNKHMVKAFPLSVINGDTVVSYTDTAGSSFTTSFPIRLKNSITSTGATSVTLETNQGKLFTLPTPFNITVKSGTAGGEDLQVEEMTVSNVTGDVFTVSRGSPAYTFDKDGTDVAMTIVDHDIFVEGLTVDCNNYSLSTDPDPNFPDTGHSFGMYFLGVRNLTLLNCAIKDSVSWTFVAGNIEGVVLIDSCRAYEVTREAGAIDDSFHLRGPWKCAIIRNCVGFNFDNSFALDWGGWEAAGLLSVADATAGNAELTIIENCQNLNTSAGTAAPLSFYGSDNTNGGDIVVRGCTFHTGYDPFIRNQNAAVEVGTCTIKTLTLEDTELTIMVDPTTLSWAAFFEIQDAHIGTMTLWNVQTDNYAVMSAVPLIALGTTGVIDYLNIGGMRSNLVTKGAGGTITTTLTLPKETINAKVTDYASGKAPLNSAQTTAAVPSASAIAAAVAAPSASTIAAAVAAPSASTIAAAVNAPSASTIAAAVNAPSAAAIAAAVLNESLGEHTGFLTTLALEDSIPTTVEIAAAVADIAGTGTGNTLAAAVHRLYERYPAKTS